MLWEKHWGPKEQKTQNKSSLKLKCIKWGVIEKLLMSHLIYKTPKSYQQLSIILQTGVTESLKNLNWMSSAFTFLVVFHAIKVERNQKNRKKKEKMVKNPFNIQQYIPAGNIKARINHSRNWESETAFKQALSYWTFLQWASLSCSQTAFQEFWVLKAKELNLPVPVLSTTCEH